MNKEFETQGTIDPVCPGCGATYDEIDPLDGGEATEFYCDICDTDFMIYCDIIVEYSTEIIRSYGDE